LTKEEEMLKIIGSLIVISAATITGFSYARVFSERVKQLRDIQYALRALEAEIVYTETPLSAAFNNVGLKCSKPISKLFLCISEVLNKKQVKSVLDAFNEANLDSKDELYLNKEEIEVMSSFMNSLGNTDIEGQKKNFNITIKKLELFEAKAEENKSKNEKLYKYLGVSAGLLVVIVLF
jgi:stage III sporulation protein AB